MGYHTDFNGQFTLDKPLTTEHANYLRKFSETRRMKRNPALTEKRDDPIRKAVGLPVGRDGGYFVGEGGYAGQDSGNDVVDDNCQPAGQPNLWCQWTPTQDGQGIEWDGGEKFYDYVKWIEYLIANFLKPWGYTVNGEVAWSGEDHSDMGKIIVQNNVVETKRANITY